MRDDQSAVIPFIDSYDKLVEASPAVTWDSLLTVVGASFTGPGSARFARLLGCEPAGSGAEALDLPGSTMPGFRVAAVDRLRRLELEGRHRFASYRLVFVLEAIEPSRCRVSAETWAEFPGLAGRAYRALVIGTRAHVVVVRRMLAAVARRADRCSGSPG
jgi:hypothetical protein